MQRYVASPKSQSETSNTIQLPELLFDDVLSVERAGEEHDIFANTLRQQGIEVLLLTDLLTQTLDIPEAKSWLLETQISDYRLGPTFATDVRTGLQRCHTGTLLVI